MNLACFRISFAFLLCSTIAAAQNSKASPNLTDIIFSRPHISLTIWGGLTGKSDVPAAPYKYQLGSSPMIAFGTGINYHLHIDKEWSLVGGIHLSTVARNFEYYIFKDEFVPAIDFDVFDNGGSSSEVYFLFRFPLSIEKRWWNKHRYWTTGLGVSVNYGLLHQEEIWQRAYLQSGQVIEYGSMLLQTNNDFKPWLNYHASGGPGWVLKNKNLLSLQLLLNLSCTKFVKGDYTMTVPGQPVVGGRYGFKGSFAAISANYTLTGGRKRMRLWKQI